MRILVTGCAGFIGSHLVERLLREGHAVLGVDNFDPFYSVETKKENVREIRTTAQKTGQVFELHEVDIRNERQLSGVFGAGAFDAVVHLAALAGVRASIENPILFSDVNVTGTMSVFEAARKQGIKKVVFASSSSVYGNCASAPFREDVFVDAPISHYAASKRAGEISSHAYHALYGMSVACLRFFTVYGPRQRPDLAINKFTTLMMDNKPVPVYGDGTQKRDFTYIEDIIDGVVLTLSWLYAQQKPCHEIFNLGESETTSVCELLDVLEAALCVAATRQKEKAVAGDVFLTHADINKARAVLGYFPKTKIKEGIEKYVAWIKRRRAVS